MLDILFYVFSTLTLVTAALMVLSPNAVSGAMCMIVSFIGTAALFVLLEAYFLAVLQILVYAGAVMVLFLFIIMLMDEDCADNRAMYQDKLSLGAALISFALVVILVVSTFSAGEHLPEPTLLPVTENPVDLSKGMPYTTAAKSFGYSLFTKYMLPFQVTGFLLLSAMVGVIVVSKKYQADPKEEEAS